MLKEITRCARTLMTPSMVSFHLGIDEMLLHDDINTIGHPARRAYYSGLEERLRQVGYDGNQRNFTPQQVQTIVDALGEP